MIGCYGKSIIPMVVFGLNLAREHVTQFERHLKEIIDKMRSFHVYHFICGHLSLLKDVPPETRNLGHLEKNFICIQKAKHSIHLVIERDYFALTYSKNCTFIKCGR